MQTTTAGHFGVTQATSQKPTAYSVFALTV